MRFGLSAASVAVLTTMIFLPGAALATCKNGMCVSGHDEGNTHYIDFYTTLKNVTHFNFNDGSGQKELGANQTQVTMALPANRPATIHYAFQGCSGGGFLQSSKCSAWANFTHTAN
jgi:hypothetical protein